MKIDLVFSESDATRNVRREIALSRSFDKVHINQESQYYTSLIVTRSITLFDQQLGQLW